MSHCNDVRQLDSVICIWPWETLRVETEVKQELDFPGCLQNDKPLGKRFAWKWTSLAVQAPKNLSR